MLVLFSSFEKDYFPISDYLEIKLGNCPTHIRPFRQHLADVFADLGIDERIELLVHGEYQFLSPAGSMPKLRSSYHFSF